MYAAGQYEDAVRVYSDAIKLSKDQSDIPPSLLCILHANRCACYLSLRRGVPACRDAQVACDLVSSRACRHCQSFTGCSGAHHPLSVDNHSLAHPLCEQDPTFWKAHWRLGSALMMMTPKRFRTQSAIQAYEACFACEGLPDKERPAVQRALTEAQQRLATQEAETPMPEQCGQQ